MLSKQKLRILFLLLITLSLIIVIHQCEGKSYGDDDEDDRTYHDFPTLDERDSESQE